MRLWLGILEIRTLRTENDYRIIGSLGIYCNHISSVWSAKICLLLSENSTENSQKKKKMQWRLGSGFYPKAGKLKKNKEKNSELLLLFKKHHPNTLTKLEFMNKLRWICKGIHNMLILRRFIAIQSSLQDRYCLSSDARFPPVLI